LSGLSTQTSGKIRIYGMDIGLNMNSIRSMMGVCPQENILFDKLTVQEHLEVFAGIKGLVGEQGKAAVNKMMKEVDLEEQEKTKALDLSGGQKRKLCLGMALIGDPKILLLDEVTSGMDPYSRRKVWDLLQKTKKDHVTLLTTHSMDEADILADRKAILSNGNIRCEGSSLFLKSRFGLGYHLNIVTGQGCNVKALETLIGKFIPQFVLLKQMGIDYAYNLPMASVNNFPQLFTALEENKDTLKIQTYFISMTSLEEVFLNLEKEEETDKGDSMIPDIASHEPEVPKAVKKKATQFVKYQTLTKYRFKQVPRNIRGFLVSVVVPIYFVIIGLLMSIVVPDYNTDEVPLPLTNSFYFMTNLPYANNTASSIDSLLNYFTSDDSFASVNSVLSTLNAVTHPMPAIQSRSLVTPQAAMHLEQRSPLGFYESFNNSNPLNPDFWGFMVSQLDYSQIIFDYLIVFNDSYPHTVPISIQELTNSFLSAQAQFLGFGNFSIHATNYPLPYPVVQFDANSYISFLFIGLALCFAPCGFATELVKEREKKIKHQLSVMGVNPVIYWLSAFTRDFALLSIPAIIVIILIWAMNIESLTGDAFIFVFFLILFFMPTMISFIYLLSMMFDRYQTCQTYLPALVNILGMFPYLLIAGLDMGGEREISTILHYVFVVWNPPYAIIGGLHFIGMVSILANVENREPTMSDYLDPANSVLPTLLIVVVDFFLIILGINLYSHYRNRQAIPKGPERSLLSPDNEDSDGQEFEEDIEVINLRKTFPIPDENSGGFCSKQKKKEKVVVDGVDFSVGVGQCYGLLGPNGAGKTTTLSMLTGSTYPTSGTAKIGGYDLSKERIKVFEVLGYCPQHDALFDELTPEEHLKLYATIKDIDPTTIQNRVEGFLQMMGIVEHKAKQSKNISGGTKRKLSFAISLVGEPTVAIMDEPSTGMDPASRHKMWLIVRKNIGGKASILTTHSMEEAEELCTNIGIMIKGKMECSGSPQELKERFGEGYQLDVKVPVAKVTEFKAFLGKLFSETELVEEHLGRMTYKIPKNQITLAALFGSFEENKRALEIEDYSISQTTLEQVFISFAKRQES